MSYWLAPALVALRNEVNALWPGRDKTSDGWIGDKRHADSKSDHNPAQWPGAWAGVVRALDLDNDLGPGANGRTLWDALAQQLGKHPALGRGAYLIYDRRIISTDRLREGTRPYTGVNPHTGHIHVSVGTSPDAYNSTVPWGIGGNKMTPEQHQLLLDVHRMLGAAGATSVIGPTESDKTLGRDIKIIRATVEGLVQAVKDIDGVDPSAIDAAVAAGVKRGIKSIGVTVAVTDE